ncbi:glycosyltransferase [Devosia geojensis]|uniref:glycosyltransferase n=1 Tax=Devosia geojensis TaxID=443610 RepID=UPI000698BF9B|nr:glycosyltransferase [Devosia geojensis]
MQMFSAAMHRPDVCFLVRAMAGGGAQRDAVLLANGLAAMGIITAIATLGANGPLAELVDRRVRFIDLGEGRRRRMALAAGPIARFLRTGRPRVLVASEASGNGLAVLVSRLLPAAERPRLVLREVASPLAARRHDPHWQNRLGYRLAPLLYAKADLLVTLSQGARDELVTHFGLSPAQVVNLGTNAVLTDMGARAPDGTREAGLIVNVARLSREKDHETLLLAFASLIRTHPARLVIVGDGPERARIEQTIAMLGLAGHVTLAGFLADPTPLLARAALFASASRHEGLGNALIEAMALGVPVVATNAPHGPREVLAGGRLGALVPVGDAEALADAMAGALDAPPAPEALRARASDFTVARAAARFANLLRERSLLPAPLPLAAPEAVHG